MSLRFGRSSAQCVAIAGLGLVNLTLILELAIQNAPIWTLIGLGLATCIIFFWALRDWWKTPDGDLVWNGNGWRWSLWSHDAICHIQWTVDLPGFSVMRVWTAGGRTQWLLAGPSVQQRPQWVALRRALVADGGRGLGNSLAPPTL